ncbi:MAG: ThuA domain-containing protein [Verrucomicrobiae bacterium]|nr:ThuA domain-containing protein [Verrucomicrobiae bacterium]
MNSLRRISATVVALLFVIAAAESSAAEKKKGGKKPQAPSVGPEKAIRALLITGGCCHNYFVQSKLLTEGVSQNVNVAWTVLHDGGKGTQALIKLYDNPEWAKNYDIVIHNECFANTTDEDYIRRVTRAHKNGTPAIVIHCAMHTYRATTIDDWREFLGVSSFRHDHQSRYPVKVVAKDHPIMKGFPSDWVTPMDELYVIEKLWPNAKALATSVSEKSKEAHPVFWTNQYGKARVFGTTYGHSDETFGEKPFIDAISNGLLWATGHLK